MEFGENSLLTQVMGYVSVRNEGIGLGSGSGVSLQVLSGPDLVLVAVVSKEILQGLGQR